MPNHSMEELLKWIQNRNETVKVSIQKNSLTESETWYYDDAAGEIRNRNGSFFAIRGIQERKNGVILTEQPIILQEEIGYLGILRREFGGEMHYLMQAKIEPGNINKIQISPTIQATKSNFTQKHGGKKPPYLAYFINASKYRIIVDQIQSEQSSRFLKKRNRNIILEIEEDIEVLPSHMWMTIHQIKELMRYDNLVNMDTRTVLSCLPLWRKEYLSQIKNEALKRSILAESRMTTLYSYINDYKMFDESDLRIVPLYDLESWHYVGDEFVCKSPYSFKVVFCDIEIEGREVRRWTQPLFEATGISVFGLLICVEDGVQKFLVRAKPEIGCFDKIELGPSVQREYIHDKSDETLVDKLFDAHLKEGKGIIFDTLLSEEGGRFYHEQNRNVIIEIDKKELPELPNGFFWTEYRTLLEMLQINNCLNIQLRNLLSVLEW